MIVTKEKPNKDSICSVLKEWIKSGADSQCEQKKSSGLNTRLNDKQWAAFQLCIEFLSKNDWDRQMNKK